MIQSICRFLVYTEPLTMVTFMYCSAGVGRTGAFIALSVSVERLKAENTVDMYQTVKLLRTQRPHMVQSTVIGNNVF